MPANKMQIMAAAGKDYGADTRAMLTEADEALIRAGGRVGFTKRADGTYTKHCTPPSRAAADRAWLRAQSENARAAGQRARRMLAELERGE